MSLEIQFLFHVTLLLLVLHINPLLCSDLHDKNGNTETKRILNMYYEIF